MGFDPTIYDTNTKTFDLSFDRVTHINPKNITLNVFDRVTDRSEPELRKKTFLETNIFLICTYDRRTVIKYNNSRKCINGILKEIDQEIEKEEKDRFGIV